MWRRLLNSVENHFYPQKIKKAGKEEVETQVPGQMTDKWTMGLSNEGLYNEVSPPKERDTKKEEEKKHQEITTVASGKIQPKGKHFI